MKSTFSALSPLAVIAVLSASAGVLSANAAEKRMTFITPLAGVSFDLGNSHAMTYFVADKGVCNLTMVTTDIVADGEMPVSAGTRFNVAIEGGKRARIDTPVGKSVEFLCSPGATMVNLRKLDMVAHSATRVE